MNNKENSTNIEDSNSLKEVRDWKKQIENEMKNMSANELIEYYNHASERMAKSINAKVVYTSDNKIRFVRDDDKNINYNS